MPRPEPRAAALACLVAALLAACSERQQRHGATAADPVDPRATGRHGDLTVGPAFTSAELRGSAGGPRDARDLGDACRGHITADPGHIVHVDEPALLTFDVTPDGSGVLDTTLAVVGPDGAASCADDTRDLDPMVAGLFEPGDYRVWVGVTGDVAAPYRLGVQAGVHTPEPLTLGGRFPAPIRDGAPAARIDDGAFGGVRFATDTAAVELPGQAGGTRPGTDLAPTCRGWFPAVPSHAVLIDADVELTLHVHSDGDTTLALVAPAGEVTCADDEDGLDPVIRRSMPPGRYSIYVGAYDEQAAPTYSLLVSR